jgi:hypothetical protein
LHAEGLFLARKQGRTLFCGVAQGLVGLLNHTPHVTDAFGALWLALAMPEHLRGMAGAGRDRLAHLSLSDAIAIADVHARLLPQISLLQI